MAESPVWRRAYTEAEPREFWSAAERHRKVSSNAMYVSSRKLEYDVHRKLALEAPVLDRSFSATCLHTIAGYLEPDIELIDHFAIDVTRN